jgi:hypothetical protein
MTKDMFLTNLADILFIKKEALTADVPLRSCEGWDSMGQIAVLALIDDANLGVEVPLNWIGGCQQIGQILELVEPHLEK